MSRRLSFAIAGLEALFVVVLGLAIVLLPLSAVWLFENDSSVDWMTAFRGAVDVWLLAHGVQLSVAAGSLLGIAVPKFVIGLVPLGLTAVILAAAFRMGRRFANAATLWPVWFGAGAVYAVASQLLASVATTKAVAPVAWMSTLLPTLSFLIALVLGSLTGRHRNGEAPERARFIEWWQERRRKMHWAVRALWQPAWRAGSITVALLLAISAIALSVLIALNWISVTRLYEALQVTVLGGFLATFAQLVLLPNLTVYVASWFTGAGFSLGAGSSLTPFGSTVGPMPSVPVFGAIPAGVLAFGLIALVVPAVCAVVATLAVRRSADEIRFEFATAWTAALSLGLAIAAVATLELTALALLASGGIGPERLQVFGVNPLWLAALAFAEFAVASVVAAFVTANPDASN